MFFLNFGRSSIFSDYTPVSVDHFLGLDQGCGTNADDVDFVNVASLSDVEGVKTSGECSHLCNKDDKCSAWTWGQVANVGGLSNTCFLKQTVKDKTPAKVKRVGVISGLRSGVACTRGQDPDVRSGLLLSRHGICLDAPHGWVGMHVRMWTCQSNNTNQQWTYNDKTGQIKNNDGLCLATVDWSKAGGAVHMYPCNTGNWSQQWTYDEPTGLVKSQKGICLDAGERNLDGGVVYIQICDTLNLNQQWTVGFSGNTTPATHEPAGSLYCFALMLPHTYEQDLLAMQHKRNVSLFACDAYSVYSNEELEVAPGVNTSIVDSDLKCGKGGEFGTALNLDIFLAVWTKVVQEQHFRHHHWTVKVDPDAVFFPERLSKVLEIHPESEEGVFINNCRFGMHGPIEVLSRNAVTKWAGGSLKCVLHFQEICNGDCFWGEDLFVDQCLWKVLNVRRDNDFRLLLEDHCEPPPNWDKCDDASAVTFHPFKTMHGYEDCLEAALHPDPKAEEAREEDGCHTAVKDEPCYLAVKWAFENGMNDHPEWYEGLKSHSKPEDFQAFYHKSHQHHCAEPCESRP